MIISISFVSVLQFISAKPQGSKPCRLEAHYDKPTKKPCSSTGNGRENWRPSPKPKVASQGGPGPGLHPRRGRALHASSPEDKDEAYNYTWKSNTIAVVSDGSAVLGLGNIGPYAAMPVMEGKAVLFKEFGGVNAVPICLDTQDTEEIIQGRDTWIAPGFGGINLEDISAPRCFEIEERLKEILDIPVFHDDQHGTAIVVLAGVINALKVTGKKKEGVPGGGQRRRQRRHRHLPPAAHLRL